MFYVTGTQTSASHAEVTPGSNPGALHLGYRTPRETIPRPVSNQRTRG